eukprot:CAMPEP_0206291674 /NCGR_PEP_ID=MMETSP0106_2-20121207/3240_1 /ASSEMBLY_ACC=CAM_ASM_000206 /TAXON_ID=81532 /ORGANISM="Acanthoeca-like sp., Strain 10tr" /LENGTH=562 /DNA_ID=CAMNT_0053722239 /DNA_START=216 /DNA_END=1905 /DNA_ORIENTATION=+
MAAPPTANRLPRKGAAPPGAPRSGGPRRAVAAAEGAAKRWLGDTLALPRRAHPFLSPPEARALPKRRPAGRLPPQPRKSLSSSSSKATITTARPAGVNRIRTRTSKAREGKRKKKESADRPTSARGPSTPSVQSRGRRALPKPPATKTHKAPAAKTEAPPAIPVLRRALPPPALPATSTTRSPASDAATLQAGVHLIEATPMPHTGDGAPVTSEGLSQRLVNDGATTTVVVEIPAAVASADPETSCDRAELETVHPPSPPREHEHAILDRLGDVKARSCDRWARVPENIVGRDADTSGSSVAVGTSPEECAAGPSLDTAGHPSPRRGDDDAGDEAGVGPAEARYSPDPLAVPETSEDFPPAAIELARTIRPQKRNRFSRQLSGSAARGGRPLSMVVESMDEAASAGPTSVLTPGGGWASPLREEAAVPANDGTASDDGAGGEANDSASSCGSGRPGVLQLGDIDFETACTLLHELEIAACLLDAPPAEATPFWDDRDSGSEWTDDNDNTDCNTELPCCADYTNALDADSGHDILSDSELYGVPEAGPAHHAFVYHPVVSTDV